MERSKVSRDGREVRGLRREGEGDTMVKGTGAKGREGAVKARDGVRKGGTWRTRCMSHGDRGGEPFGRGEGRP